MTFTDVSGVHIICHRDKTLIMLPVFFQLLGRRNQHSDSVVTVMKGKVKINFLPISYSIKVLLSRLNKCLSSMIRRSKQCASGHTSNKYFDQQVRDFLVAKAELNRTTFSLERH